MIFETVAKRDGDQITMQDDFRLYVLNVTAGVLVNMGYRTEWVLSFEWKEDKNVNCNIYFVVWITKEFLSSMQGIWIYQTKSVLH